MLSTPPIEKRKSTYAVSCSLSKANLRRSIVCLAELRVISVARGRKNARGKERTSREAGWRGWEDQSSALLPLQSRVRPHSFICRRQRCSTCDANPGRPPTSCVGRPGSYMGRMSCIVHTRTLVHAAQQCDSRNWRRHLSGRIVLSCYGPAKIYALYNCY